MDGNIPIRRHLVIAGTGRAGTSFLVRYLAELGLDTHLSRRGESMTWDEDANAGLEDMPLLTPRSDLPYVIKWPWLYSCIDELLTDATFVPDAVVIPVRDLAEAAVSRSVVERRAIHQQAHWMVGLERSWEDWAHVPGGVIYSLNPIDQGRLLAVGFHHLVQRLVAADIPIILLSFPQLIKNAAYLFDKLRPVLPRMVDREAACLAHQRVANPVKVRVGGEIRAAAPPHNPPSAKIMAYESHVTLDAIALRRELERIRKDVAKMRYETARANEQIRSSTEVEGVLREGARQDYQKIHDLTQEVLRLQQQMMLESQQRRQLAETLAEIRASRSWWLTRPYRIVGSMVMNALRGSVRKFG